MANAEPDKVGSLTTTDEEDDLLRDFGEEIHRQVDYANDSL
jgi:hypothetical protein